MLLFKTSGITLSSVVENKKHALHHQPKNWQRDEILLISKNKKDCNQGEKQIQYIMRLNSIQTSKQADIKKYWPTSDNSWNYIVNCETAIKLKNPFNLIDILAEDSLKYRPSIKPMKLEVSDEKTILNFLMKNEVLTF